MGEWKGVELDGLVLHSGRLTLRPWQPSDATVVEAIMADARMHAYLPLPNPYTAADAVEFVTNIGPGRAAAGAGLDVAVCENTTGRVVGAVGLHLEGAGDRAEVGYWTATAEWGKGYATEAANTITRFGLGNGLKRIAIRCEAGNVASARVALACGFQYEGVERGFPVRGTPVTGPVFSRLAADPGEPIKPTWPRVSSLTDGIVSVRPMTDADWPTLLGEANNAEALAWSFTGERLTEGAARDKAARAALDWLVGDKAIFVICDAATGLAGGTLYVLRSGPMDVGLIGYGVLPEFRGRGFTTRALNLVADWVFSTTSIGRLELGHKVENIASGKAALRAGFQREATLAGRLRNHDGSFSDEMYYGRTRG